MIRNGLRIMRSSLERYEAYEKVLSKIEKSDPSINKSIEQAIKQLEQRGAKSLSRRSQQQVLMEISCDNALESYALGMLA